MCDGPGADEGDVGDVRVGGQVVGGGGPEREGLQEVGRVAAGLQGVLGDGGEEGGRPGRLLGGFEEEGGAGEEGGDGGAEEVVELVGGKRAWLAWGRERGDGVGTG